MLPPYDTEEVAEAVLREIEASGSSPIAVTVLAHLPERRWVVMARLQGRVDVRMTVPFSRDDGIPTPAELAEELLARLRAP